MPQIQLEQLKPGTESTTVITILNTSQHAAYGAIELLRLSETKPSLSSYITVSIRELSAEPMTAYPPHPLSELYKSGYTKLSSIAPTQTQEYELRFIVSKDIPPEYQKQKIVFDLRTGTEQAKATQTPRPPQNTTIEEIARPSPTVLGTTTERQPSPATQERTTKTPLILVGTVAFILFLLIFILLLLHKRLRPR